MRRNAMVGQRPRSTLVRDHGWPRKISTVPAAVHSTREFIIGVDVFEVTYKFLRKEGDSQRYLLALDLYSLAFGLTGRPTRSVLQLPKCGKNQALAVVSANNNPSPPSPRSLWQSSQ